MAEVDKHQLLSRAFSHSDCAAGGTKNVNNDSQLNIFKRYLVYMELPKIKIGDYHKSSCVVGHILRFHFLMKISEDENVPLTLLPIKVYKVPIVNVAVIHRPFIEDDTAKGPIPKSPDVKSPMLKYSSEERDQAVETDENLEEDFAKSSADAARLQREEEERLAEAQVQQQQREQKQQEQQEQQQREQQQRQESDGDADAQASRSQSEDGNIEKRHQRDSSKHRHGGKKRKKYFVYCELPKVAVGDYRISSVTSSELIHCHFLVKIAKDESGGQPVLRPIKKYRRPRVNFAVIHRSLLVDDEATGPIPRSPGVKSPMIREDLDGDDEVEVLHATMGFNYAAGSRSKYELTTQWSLVADDSGRIVPELVLSKAND